MKDKDINIIESMARISGQLAVVFNNGTSGHRLTPDKKREREKDWEGWAKLM